MHASIVPLLACPTCGSPLHIAHAEHDSDGDITTGTLTCATGHTWPLEAGVLVCSREDAPSDPWSRTFETYAAYAGAQRDAVRDARVEVAPLLARLPVAGPGPLLETCTGQGALLFNLLDHLDPQVEVVSVDMSPTIQTYNRRRQRERYTDRRVSFIACDATILPFKAGTLRGVVSFGMGNMMAQLRQGIYEVARVLAPGGAFRFTHQFVEEASEGWRIVVDMMTAPGTSNFRYLGIESAFLEMMRASPFGGCAVDLVAEVVGDPERDLSTGIFPYPNEKLREVVITAARPASPNPG